MNHLRPEVINALLQNDTAGLSYDCDAALHFIQTTTGVSDVVCARVLEGRDWYRIGFGIAPPDMFVDFVIIPKRLHAMYPALFRPQDLEERAVWPALERAFVAAEMQLDESIVRSVLEADDEYMRRRGILVAVVV